MDRKKRSLKRRIAAGFAVSLFLVPPAANATGSCALFYDGLDNAASIAENGGIVSGTLHFDPGVNGQAADFGGQAIVTYWGDLYRSLTGAVSFWVRKSSADAEGGILQIGTLGQPNSMGVFYVNQTDLIFEIRNNASEVAATWAPGALSQSGWTHVVAIWNQRAEGCDTWLFVNGFFKSYDFLPGSLLHNANWLQLGYTGYYGYGACLLDEIRVFDRIVSDDEAYAELVFSSNRFHKQPTVKPVSTGLVQLIGGQIYVDGRRFEAKGVGYQPVPIGANISREILDFIYTDPIIIARDMTLLRGMNVNTIRTWSQVPDATLLDACYNGGNQSIRVVMGYWVPLDPGVDYSNPATIVSIKAEFQSYVARFKHHPAVLAWGIGNENNLAYAGDIADWYALADQLAQVAYLEEGAGYHPAMVVNGGMRHFADTQLGSDDASLPFVDMWGHNAYPGENWRCYFDYYDRLSAKPLLLTEFGIDALDNRVGAEYQLVQAEYVTAQWRGLRRHSIGGTVMAYSDEWWKAGAPWSHDPGGYGTHFHPDGYSNEEWWGLVAVQDNGSGPDIMVPRAVYGALGQEYAIVPGDCDCDGRIDGADIRAFVLALINPSGYCLAYPACHLRNADANGDGVVNAADVGPFRELLLCG
jgi:hypothetical protein